MRLLLNLSRLENSVISLNLLIIETAVNPTEDIYVSDNIVYYCWQINSKGELEFCSKIGT